MAPKRSARGSCVEGCAMWSVQGSRPSPSLCAWRRLDARGLQAAAKDSKFIGEDNVAAGKVLQRLRAKEATIGNAATKAAGALLKPAPPE